MDTHAFFRIESAARIPRYGGFTDGHTDLVVGRSRPGVASPAKVAAAPQPSAFSSLIQVPPRSKEQRLHRKPGAIEVAEVGHTVDALVEELRRPGGRAPQRLRWREHGVDRGTRRWRRDVRKRCWGGQRRLSKLLYTRPHGLVVEAPLSLRRHTVSS
jgi:hypothetical protein